MLRTLLTVALAVATLTTSVAFAHDDDGKIRDRQKPFRGPAWFEGKSNGGVAGGGFASSGVQLKSWLPLNTLSAGAQNGNSCWGWISPAGRDRPRTMPPGRASCQSITHWPISACRKKSIPSVGSIAILRGCFY
jgi:hypothetical protein